MSTWVALVLLGVALAVVVSAGLVIPRPSRSRRGVAAPSGAGEVESELLRRPLRSRYNA